MRVWSEKRWARHGNEHSQWRGGVSVTGDGYTKLNINLVHKRYWSMADSSGWVLEHRYAMAKRLGRPLHPSEVVHHKDGNKRNNCLTNLELLTRREHAQQHNGNTIMLSGKRARKEVYDEKTQRSYPTVGVAASYAGLHPTTVFRLLRRGERFFYTGEVRRYSNAEIAAHLLSCRREARRVPA